MSWRRKFRQARRRGWMKRRAKNDLHHLREPHIFDRTQRSKFSPLCKENCNEAHFRWISQSLNPLIAQLHLLPFNLRLNPNFLRFRKDGQSILLPMEDLTISTPLQTNPHTVDHSRSLRDHQYPAISPHNFLAASQTKTPLSQTLYLSTMVVFLREVSVVVVGVRYHGVAFKRGRSSCQISRSIRTRFLVARRGCW